jgi:microsomal prostaglandin-E synthase 2
MKSRNQLPLEFKDSSDPEIEKWMEFTDRKLAVLLFPNITRNMLESWEAFGYINKVPHFNAIQKIILRMTGALAMRVANGRIKRKYNIEDERGALLTTVREWIQDGLRGRRFHGGDEPDLADVVVYGCLKSIEEFTTFAWLVGDTDREFLVWFNRMGKEIPNSSCVSRE